MLSSDSFGTALEMAVIPLEPQAEAIALALTENARVLGIDDKNGINACKLLSVAFTTIGMLVRMCEKRLGTTSEALAKLVGLAKHGRYRKSIL